MNDKTEDFTVKAQRLRDAREKIIELIKGSPDQVDIAVRQFDQHRAMMYGLSPEYPLLVDKALKRIRCESPHFTEGELQERRRLIENLVAAVIASAIKRRANKQKGQREQDADIESIQRDCHDYLNTGLYLLARCGDESAYLELAERDITFWSNYFFYLSYLEWKLMAYHGDKKQVESRLRKLATIFQKPCEPPTKTRQINKDHFILGQFQEYKERFPKLSRHKIYEKIAKDWKVEYRKPVTPDAVRKRLERFHKRAWPFKYLEREYREEI